MLNWLSGTGWIYLQLLPVKNPPETTSIWKTCWIFEWTWECGLSASFFALGWCCSPKPTDGDKVTKWCLKNIVGLKEKPWNKDTLNYMFGIPTIQLHVKCWFFGHDLWSPREGCRGNLWNVMPCNMFDIDGILGCHCCYFVDEVWSLPMTYVTRIIPDVV